MLRLQFGVSITERISLLSASRILEQTLCCGGLEGEGERCNGYGVTEDRRQVEVKRQEDRQAKLRLRFWVVAEKEEEREEVM